MLVAALLVALAVSQTPAEEPLPPDMVPAEPAKPVPEAAPGERPAAAAAAPGDDRPPRQLSLLSAEPLGGGSAALAWAGWSSLGVMYGQGITRVDDVGASLDFDWAKTELRLGGFYRRPLGRAGGFDMAGRLGASWLANFGNTWIHDENHHDRGVELAPSLVLSARTGGGIFSLQGDLPLAVTWKHDSGVLFIPRLTASFETPLYEELTIGVRAGAAYRAGSGDAPLRDEGGELQFLVVLGYQVL